MDIARAIMPQGGNMDTPADNGHEDMVMSEIEDQDQDENEDNNQNEDEDQDENENENENKTKNEDQDEAEDVDADKRNIQETKGTKSKSITGKRKHAAMPWLDLWTMMTLDWGSLCKSKLSTLGRLSKSIWCA